MKTKARESQPTKPKIAMAENLQNPPYTTEP